jgi:hypothetical protein
MMPNKCLVQSFEMLFKVFVHLIIPLFGSNWTQMSHPHLGLGRPVLSLCLTGTIKAV